MARELFDLEVGCPAPPEFGPSFSMVQADETVEQRPERVMRFVLSVRALLHAPPITLSALAALTIRILAADPEGEVPVVCGAPLGLSPQRTCAAVLSVCAMWGMPAKVVVASEGKAAELAAILAAQRDEHDGGGAYAN